LIWQPLFGNRGPSPIPGGGVPGDFPPLPSQSPQTPNLGNPNQGDWKVDRESVPTQWDLTNQHWSCRLAPATQPALATILQTIPSLPDFNGQNITLPTLGDITTKDIEKISPH
jgi:hypothetical protein